MTHATKRFVRENPISDPTKKLLLVGGVGLAAGVGLVLVWHRRASAATIPAALHATSIMPELPATMPPPFKVLTLTDNNANVVVPANSRIDVVLPYLEGVDMDWSFSYNGSPSPGGGSAARPLAGFELNLADSTGSAYAAITQNGPMAIRSFFVAGSSGSTLNLQYDMVGGTTKSTVKFTLTIQ